MMYINGTRMTVRKAIRKIRELHSHVLITGNGTEILFWDFPNSPWDCIGRIKIGKNGEKIFRDIFCTVNPSCATVDMEMLQKYSMYTPGYGMFREQDYVIPERDMNLFLNQNGGVDVYRTFDCPAYMLYG